MNRECKDSKTAIFIYDWIKNKAKDGSKLLLVANLKNIVITINISDEEPDLPGRDIDFFTLDESDLLKEIPSD